MKLFNAALAGIVGVSFAATAAQAFTLNVLTTGEFVDSTGEAVADGTPFTFVIDRNGDEFASFGDLNNLSPDIAVTPPAGDFLLDQQFESFSEGGFNGLVETGSIVINNDDFDLEVGDKIYMLYFPGQTGNAGGGLFDQEVGIIEIGETPIITGATTFSNNTLASQGGVPGVVFGRTAIPEPTTGLIVLGGALAAMARRRRSA